MRILVIDDERLILLSTQRLLARVGHEVDAAMDAAGALSIMDEKPHDLVLCDYVLSGGRSDTLVAEIRSRHPETKVILMSGALSMSGLSAVPADAFIEKPFLINELNDIITRLFPT